MRKRIIISLGAITLGVAGLAAAFSARAGEGRMNWHGRGGRPPIEFIVNRIGSRLDLTGEQKAQVISIINAERVNAEPLFAQLKKNWREMREATAGGQFDEEQVRTLAASQAQTVTELIVAKERTKSKVYAVLTPEQRAKADQFLEQMESRFGGRFGDRT